MSLGNRFVSDWERRLSDIAVVSQSLDVNGPLWTRFFLLLNVWDLEIPYEVTVWTADVRGAGTDANVFIQMYGEYGKSETYQLRNRTDNFEQGQMDKFKV